jgi:hypothetical protein
LLGFSWHKSAFLDSLLIINSLVFREKKEIKKKEAIKREAAEGFQLLFANERKDLLYR